MPEPSTLKYIVEAVLVGCSPLLDLDGGLAVDAGGAEERGAHVAHGAALQYHHVIKER